MRQSKTNSKRSQTFYAIRKLPVSVQKKNRHIEVKQKHVRIAHVVEVKP